MKKIMSVLTVGILIFALMTITPQTALAAEKIVPAEQNSFANVARNLDQGGDFYMYISSEKFIKFFEEMIGFIKQIALSETKEPAKKEEIETNFNLITKLLRDSGLFEISGVGMSSIKLANGLNHEKTIIHHYPGMGKGLIWHLAEDNPHAFASQELLPANTVFANFSDSKLDYFWQWLQKEAAESGLPKLQEAVQAVGPMLASKDIDLNALIGSLDGESGIILTLDDAKMCKIPVKNVTLEFPEPALAIVMYVKNDALFNLLQKLVPIPPQGDGKTKKITGPVIPLPITLNPTVAQEGNLLIFATNGKIVDEILARQKGLSKSAEFAKLSVDMPQNGNAYTFLSAKVMKTLFAVQYQAAAAAGEESKKQVSLFERLNLFPKDLAIYSVKQNTAEGFIQTSNNNLPMGGTALLPAMAVGGVVAAIAIPNLLTAQAKGKQKATMGDLKMISVAVAMYIEDKGYAPKVKTMAELKTALEPFYIKKLPMKDAWGHDLLYIQGIAGKADAYCIASSGRDGVFAGFEQAGFYPVTAMDHFNQDIILCSGVFTYGPKVK